MYTYISIVKQALSTAAGLVVLVFFIIPMTGLAQVEPTPLNAPTITVSGQNLPQVAPFASTLVATSSTIWDVFLNFDEDTTEPAVVADGTPFFDFTNGSLQIVDDCADSDAKTYCFTYVPPSGIEAAIFWFFRVSGATNNSGGYMATTTYRFVVDTAGPVLQFTNVIGAQLPTIEGNSSFGSATLNINFSNAEISRTYQTNAVSGLWSLTLQTGDELPPGTYTVKATGIDQNQNIGATIETTIEIPDTIPPVLTESIVIPTSAITTPTYAFIANEFSTLSYTGACISPTLTAATGTNIIIFNALVPETYTDCAITATDGAGNMGAPLLITPFTITPPPVGSLIVTVTATGGDGTFNLSGNGSVGAFTVTTTGGLGQKTFESLDAGGYQISQVTPSGWTLGSNSCATVTVLAGDTAACSIAYAKNTSTSKKSHIIGLLFNDKNGDGKFNHKKEGSVLGSSGWRVYLDNNNNATRDSGEPSTLTTLFGLYFFKDINPGTYTVRLELKPNKTLTTPTSGSLTATVVAKYSVFAGFFGWK